MPRHRGSYWSATRHPWSCVLFVLPLLLTYEIGLYLLGSTPPEEIRNGADVWLRSGLAACGVSPSYGAPLILIAVLFAWGFIYREPHRFDYVGVWVGMAIESALYAWALFGLSRAIWPWLQDAGQVLESGKLLQVTGASPEALWEQIVRFLGAGIYEETLFRLLLFAALLAVFHLAELPGWLAMGLAALGSALLFAAAHNLGASGEPFRAAVFLFRTLAGVYFAWIYYWRGFGIAVGAHAGYDVLVGILLRTPLG